MIHCRLNFSIESFIAGKGRSGTIACSYLITEEGWTKEDALSRFTERRMRARFGAGVSIPSQLRYVGYVERWSRDEKRVYVDGAVEVLEVRTWGLRDCVKVSVKGYVECGRQIKTFYVFEEEDVVVNDAVNTTDAAQEDVDAETKEDQEVMTVLRPSEGKKIILPTNDINVCFERRRHAAVLNKMIPISVAHVWFNAFFEALPLSNSDSDSAIGDEKESKTENENTNSPLLATAAAVAAGSGVRRFSIPWEALDGIKGGSFKGSKALDRVEVVFQRCL